MLPRLLVLIMSTLRVQSCLDNMLWKDSYGWTCRDYDRVPQECSSRLAVSAAGVNVFEACCACKSNVDRRRDYASCLNTCSAKEDSCNADCTATQVGCVGECTEKWDTSEDTANVLTPSPVAQPMKDSSSIIEPWMIVAIAVGFVVLLCILCILFMLFCMPNVEESCQGDIQEQPMLFDRGCDMPCGNVQEPCDGAKGISYAPIEQYPVRQDW